MSRENKIGIQFHVTRDLHRRLNRMADGERRSMTQQVITVLEDALDRWEAEQQDAEQKREPEAVAA